MNRNGEVQSAECRVQNAESGLTKLTKRQREEKQSQPGRPPQGLKGKPVPHYGNELILCEFDFGEVELGDGGVDVHWGEGEVADVRFDEEMVLGV
jgi:hypothetical protein